jgi:hypothetical protein
MSREQEKDRAMERIITNPDHDDTPESSDDYDVEDMNGVGPPSSDCGNNSVQTNSLASLPNSQPAVLLGNKSYVFIEGGSTGEALFRIRMAVMGYTLHSPLSPSLLLLRAGLCHHIVIGLNHASFYDPIVSGTSVEPTQRFVRPPHWC